MKPSSRFLSALTAVLLPVASLAQRVVEAEPGSETGGAIIISVVQLLFLMVPASVVLQVFALLRLDGNRRRLAKMSAWAMGALWLFVIVTGFAGSNLSPIWLVFLSPFFVLFLGVLLFRSYRSGKDDDSLLPGSGR